MIANITDETIETIYDLLHSKTLTEDATIALRAFLMEHGLMIARRPLSISEALFNELKITIAEHDNSLDSIK